MKLMGTQRSNPFKCKGMGTQRVGQGAFQGRPGQAPALTIPEYVRQPFFLNTAGVVQGLEAEGLEEALCPPVPPLTLFPPSPHPPTVRGPGSSQVAFDGIECLWSPGGGRQHLQSLLGLCKRLLPFKFPSPLSCQARGQRVGRLGPNWSCSTYPAFPVSCLGQGLDSIGTHCAGCWAGGGMAEWACFKCSRPRGEGSREVTPQASSCRDGFEGCGVSPSWSRLSGKTPGGLWVA